MEYWDSYRPNSVDILLVVQSWFLYHHCIATISSIRQSLLSFQIQISPGPFQVLAYRYRLTKSFSSTLQVIRQQSHLDLPSGYNVKFLLCICCKILHSDLFPWSTVGGVFSSQYLVFEFLIEALCLEIELVLALLLFVLKSFLIKWSCLINKVNLRPLFRIIKKMLPAYHKHFQMLSQLVLAVSSVAVR